MLLSDHVSTHSVHMAIVILYYRVCECLVNELVKTQTFAFAYKKTQLRRLQSRLCIHILTFLDVRNWASESSWLIGVSTHISAGVSADNRFFLLSWG